MDNNNQQSSNKYYLGFITIVIVVLLATLPFHYVFCYRDFKVFTKDNFTFKDTFVTEDDIEKLIERHNSANFWDKSSIRNESLHKKLMEEGIIVTEKSKDDE